MGQARDTLDTMTAAVLKGDLDAMAACYAEDAVAMTPDEGEIKGRDSIMAYLRTFAEALSDLRYEYLQAHESGNVAIDEGWIVGTHTGPLAGPSGEVIEPTGRSIRLRECDVVTVENGLITSHRFYFDQMELAAQLGLT
jgi:ketosteroid isomerase-like protein